MAPGATALLVFVAAAAAAIRQGAAFTDASLYDKSKLLDCYQNADATSALTFREYMSGLPSRCGTPQCRCRSALRASATVIAASSMGGPLAGLLAGAGCTCTPSWATRQLPRTAGRSQWHSR